ncbi:MAG: hypothetical protein QNJ70_21265 [Xenococcaceae cyanobacterium MO_207.B15]|nr:hypothetical protein [Xenococcaceae cyanobacterium MO_207.B15]
MDTTEIKFLLKLLPYQNHRTTVSKIRLGSTVKAFVRNQVCRGLNERGLIEFTEKVVKIKISAEGLTALDEDSRRLTPLLLKVLKACQKKAISPSNTRVSAAQGREAIIPELVELGLITTKTKINEVWLTDAGRKYLAEEYTPAGGGNIILNKKMLGDYLEFLRGYFSDAVTRADVKEELGEKVVTKEKKTENSLLEVPQKLANYIHDPDGNFDSKVTDYFAQQRSILKESLKLSTPKTDKEFEHIILTLDKELGTKNYLPIPFLRAKIPQMGEEELNNALYRLQREDKIELSTIVEVVHFSPKELEKGIAQNIGGALFYISVN